MMYLGMVEQLSRYPVKSMHAEALTEAHVNRAGIKPGQPGQEGAGIGHAGEAMRAHAAR